MDQTSVKGSLTSAKRAGRFGYVATALGVLVALVGTGHLVAWFSGYMVNRGVSAVTMKTNTALVLLLAGLGLVLLASPQAESARRWTGRGLAAFAALIGLLSLGENLLGWNLGIDQLLAQEAPGAMGAGAPNLMGTPAATSFLLAGLALLILSRRDSRGAKAMQGLALAVCLIALLGTIGYLYGAQDFYAIARFTTIALPTALALLMLGLGLLLVRSTDGLMRLVTADDPGGANLRRWLPVLLLPIALGWFRLVGERLGLFDAATGTAMMMIIFIGALAILAYTGAGPVSRSSADLQRQREWLRVTLSSIGDAVIATDPIGKITFFNPVAEGLTGWKEYEILGHPVQEVFRIINEQTREQADDIVTRVLSEACVISLANHTAIQARDGREVPIEDSAAPILDAGGKVSGVVIVFHDVTEKRRALEALRKSEERYRTLFKTIDVGFCIVEMIFNAENRPIDYRFLEVNAAFEEQTGLHAVEGKLMRELAPAHEEHWFEIYGKIALTGESEHFVNEARALHRWFDVYAYRVGAPENRQIAILFNDISGYKEAEEALRQSGAELELRVQERTKELSQTICMLNERSEQLRRITSELTVAEQRERQRLAQILHDGLQQILVAAKFRVAFVPRSPNVHHATDEVLELIDDAIETSRSLSAELSPPILLQGDFVAAIEWLARWMRDKHKLEVNLTAREKIGHLNKDVILLLFQAARELLFNVVKHAEVKNAYIELNQIEGHLSMMVEDKGVGFDQNKLSHRESQSSGSGLIGISERLSYIGGRIEIDSAPGLGSRFKLIVPISEVSTEGDQGAIDKTGRVSVAISPQLDPKPAGVGKKIRIALVDDHIVVRQGLAVLLRGEPDFAIVGEASEGRAAVDLVLETKPDVVLMDISMPGMDGVEATRMIHKELPEVGIIGLSMSREGNQEAAMREAGAVNFLTKSGPAEALIEAIRACGRVSERGLVDKAAN
jgi:PAS domain S-box-containing protein